MINIGGISNITTTVDEKNLWDIEKIYAYDIGLKGGDISYASTIAYALLILVIVFSIIYFVLEKYFKKISGNE